MVSLALNKLQQIVPLATTSQLSGLFEGILEYFASECSYKLIMEATNAVY